MRTLSPKIAVTPPAICRIPHLRDNISRLFPETVFNESSQYFDEKGLVRFAGEADALLVGRDPVTAAVLDQLPSLKIVSKYGVGLDNIDEPALETRSIALGWEGGVNRRSVAELTLAFMLSLCHNVWVTGSCLKQGEWFKDGGTELSGKTIGIVGCGNVGQEVVRLLKPFGCRVLVRDILPMSDFCRQFLAEEVGWERVISESDILTLHVPLDDSTRSMIDELTINKMKPTSYLINTSRGEIVDESALKDALLIKKLGGAALDVFSQEPPQDSELISLPNLMVTPHIGGNAREAVEAMAQSAIANLQKFFGKGEA
ncbi:MAG: phosphoglycerate dehydrogenase [Candidatus Nitronauta litoralis]|uniref:Phosphoglycerate dehydrogenase n=1 Tax=Candidatus Nitronauta litoralis TaxID=2705533 RepID=A0A7T0BU47_9BACT|nr:MAG: phosphoglycerate dehydrogenase [Candidatus Nitronauta litoralis]